jgi:O-ureido-D-serine cyclo-ligase
MSAYRIALVTARAARDLDEDLPPLVDALRAAGADVAALDWDDASVDWSAWHVAALRSPWDYTQRLPEFLAWAQRAAAATALVNPDDIVRWNTDKHYLADLERAGVAIVPSRFVEPGDDAAAKLDAFLADFPTATEFVVKPCVGAGSRDARRHARSALDDALAHTRSLIDAGRSVVLQPYLDRVDDHGETALVYLDGAFSHAIRKGPLLRRGEDATRALFAAEHITPRTPSDAELALGARTLAAIPADAPLLYARVDLIHDGAGQPRVLELELSEPSLFFAHGAGSADRYAAAVLRRASAVRTA